MKRNINTTGTAACSAAMRNDRRLLRLRMEMGLQGYAIYRLITEYLTENGGSCPTADFPLMAFDFHAREEKVRQVAEGYGLFSIADGILSINGGEELAPEAADDNGDDTPEEPIAAESSTEKKRRTRRTEKKGKEKLPLHPLKRKEKEKNREERKEDGAENENGESQSGDTDAKRDNAFYTRFRQYWNATIERTNSRLRPISIVNATRRRQLDKLRRSFDDNQIGWFIYRACCSPYLNARDGRLKQPADLNWMLLSDDRIVKIIEGNL